MFTDLYRLFYVSRVAPEFSGNVDLDRILGRSRVRNAELQLTGALYFDGARFAQVLEGPLPALETTYESITRDVRHEALQILEVSPAERRQFASWAMAMIEPAELQKLVRLDFDNLPSAGVIVSGMLAAAGDR